MEWIAIHKMRIFSKLFFFPTEIVMMHWIQELPFIWAHFLQHFHILEYNMCNLKIDKKVASFEICMAKGQDIEITMKFTS